MERVLLEKDYWIIPKTQSMTSHKGTCSNDKLAKRLLIVEVFSIEKSIWKNSNERISVRLLIIKPNLNMHQVKREGMFTNDKKKTKQDKRKNEKVLHRETK